MKDEIIRMLFEFVAHASLPVGESVRLRAHGDRGDRRLRPRPAWRRAPTSICCSCCPTSRPRGASQVAEAILYCLWDLGLKVGHATRSVDECIRQAKADMTIRTAILEARFLLGDRKLFDELMTRFDKSSRAGHRAGVRRRQARRARGAPSAAPASRAIWSSRTSRTAKAACAICTRCSGSPNTSTACATSTS